MSWWRRNRWALLALPFVVALVAVSGASRLVNFWWPSQLSEPVVGSVGAPVGLTAQTWDEEGEETSIDVDVVVGPTTEAVDWTDGDGMLQRVPYVDGTRVWRTDVTFTAPAGEDPTLCLAEVVDTRGRTTTYTTTAVGAQGLPVSPCAPPFSLSEQGPRDETWTVPVLVRLTADVEPAELRIWWQPPEHVAVPLEVDAG
ncbi:hypothetical protein [Ornithinimicrobium avium]|uniref:Uncharacterized protein n=1 Tax=Ornithinimicrobium avium TaxID=2283195 RepID=A0A345NPP3_9MICO|nr:hypothetical protein [Ornithinimicrobium avium]AXH97001.1 hypothetical protein DV701_13520 [Ornithinimicrobium avium]